MIEVFKTDVEDRDHARMLIMEIHQQFADYRANFDLSDCDRILRVKSASGPVEACLLINLLKEFGFEAEVLPDIPRMDLNPVLADHIFCALFSKPVALWRPWMIQT